MMMMMMMMMYTVRDEMVLKHTLRLKQGHAVKRFEWRVMRVILNIQVCLSIEGITTRQENT